MIPYSQFYYFLLLGVLLLPVVVGGLCGNRMRLYTTLLIPIMLLIIFSDSLRQGVSLVVYAVWEWATVKAYLLYRTKRNDAKVFYGAAFLSIAPLIIVKLIPILPVMSFFGFLGISYLTFRAVQVVIEIRDGQIKKMRSVDFLRFLLFFPTLTSGPIDRYRRFQKNEEQAYSSAEYRTLLYEGLNRIFLGFLYKYIIGYSINDKVLHAIFIPWHWWVSTVVYMYAYSLYLFFDFAGYSAFAIGISYILGIRTPDNFNKPFASRNMKDFWNRWHMSLSYWFRDYIYMRLVFFLTKKKMLKNRYAVSYIGYFTLFFVMGLWHGLQLHYIVYGVYHAVLMIGCDLFERGNKQKRFWPERPWTRFVSVILTFHAVCFGFLIFSGRLFQ